MITNKEGLSMHEYETGRAPVSPAGPGRAWQEAGPPPVPARKRSVPIWAIVAMVAGAVGILLCCGVGIVSAIAGGDLERAAPVMPSESPSEPVAESELVDDAASEPEASERDPIDMFEIALRVALANHDDPDSVCLALDVLGPEWAADQMRDGYEEADPDVAWDHEVAVEVLTEYHENAC